MTTNVPYVKLPLLVLNMSHDICVLVFTPPPFALHLLVELISIHQIQVIDLTSASFVVINLQEGFYLFIYYSYLYLIPLLVIFYPAMSINAMQMKNHLQICQVQGEKLFLLLVQQLQNKPVINVFSLVYLVMVAVLVVGFLFLFCFFLFLLVLTPQLGKCLHRQRPCTFVKFHRQTAPVGPGHHNSSTTHPPPHLLSQSSSSATLYPIAPAQNPNRYPLYPPQDELLLGPSPGSQSMPENMYNPELAFSSLYPHQGDPMDVSGDPAAMDHVMMQYKISADQVRRSSMAGGVGTLYDAPPEQPQKPEWMAWDSQHQPYHGMYSFFFSVSIYIYISTEKDNHPTQQQYAPIQALPRFNYHHHPPPSSGSSSTSTSSSGHGHGHGHNSGLPPSSFPSYMLTSDRVVSGTMQHPQHPQHHHHHQRHQRQSPLGRRGSHSESSNSPSGQTSAASSSVHLPISDITAPTPNVNVNLPGPGSMSSYVSRFYIG